jgi:glycosyltransferase involved in cell wall biosynthesis
LVVDSDDDLTEDYKLVSGRGQAFKKVLGLVDHVTTSTQALADHFTQYTKLPPTPLLNCVDVDWMQAEVAQSKRLVSDKTVIGFSGSPTHWGDWYKPSVPFQRICREFPVQALLHGEVPRYLNYCQDDVLRIGGVPYSTYPRVLRQFDILLCAVDAEDKFNAGKSAVKALEAMAVGCVPLCSRFQPYMDLEEQGAPVVVIEEDTRDGWYEAMAYLVNDLEHIKYLSELGPDWVSSHRDISTGYKQWEKFFRQIGPSS